MKRIYVESIGSVGDDILLSPENTHHLIHVMRSEIGLQLELFDGGPTQATAELIETQGDAARVRVLSVKTVETPPISTTLILGLPKGPATDLAIRMATEAGVHCIIPVWAERTQGRPSRGERWHRIITSAAQQCGRTDLPVLQPPMSLADALQAVQGSDALFYGDATGSRGSSRSNDSVALAIGPEGGWSRNEVALLTAAGGQPLCFGPHTLRTETAVAIGVALCSTPQDSPPANQESHRPQ